MKNDLMDFMREHEERAEREAAKARDDLAAFHALSQEEKYRILFEEERLANERETELRRVTEAHERVYGSDDNEDDLEDDE